MVATQTKKTRHTRHTRHRRTLTAGRALFAKGYFVVVVVVAGDGGVAVLGGILAAQAQQHVQGVLADDGHQRQGLPSSLRHDQQRSNDTHQHQIKDGFKPSDALFLKGPRRASQLRADMGNATDAREQRDIEGYEYMRLW